MSPLYFFDVPVYRVTPEQYRRDREAYVNKNIGEGLDPELEIGFRDHLQRSYGGCWRFNEIVGYIRLYFLGSQVRGEYFAVRKRRVVRSRTKTLEFLSFKLAPEMDLPYPSTNDGIYATVLAYLDACRDKLPRRYVDTESFETVGPHIDWLSLRA